MKQSILSSILTSVLLAAAALPASAELAGVWNYYPAFDIYSGVRIGSQTTRASNNVAKIIEGERYIYFLIEGSLYNSDSGSKYARHPYFFPGRLDKSAANPVVEPLAAHISVSGEDVAAMEYCASGRYAAIAYSNGKIDIIHDAGKVAVNADATKNTRPGSNAVNSLSFTADGNRIFAATDFGYIEIDAASGETLDMKILNLPLNFANRIGNRVVLANDTVLYTLDPAITLPKTEDLKVVKVSGDAASTLVNSSSKSLQAVYEIMPVSNSENSFFYAGPDTSANFGFSINVVTLDGDDSCRIFTLANENIASYRNQLAIQDNMVLRHPFEGLLTPWRDGFTFASASYIYKMNAGLGDPADAESYKAAAVVKYKKDTTANPDGIKGNRQYKRHATYDGENYVFFAPYEGFVRSALSGEGNATAWTDGETYRLNSNAARIPRYISYSPEVGIILHNAGYDPYDYSFEEDMSSGLCSFRDGVWTDYHIYDRAGWALNHVIRSKGAVVDPVDPKYIFEVTPFNGLLRTNLTDLTDLLHLSHTADQHNKSLYFVDVFGNTESFWQKATFAIPTFDGDNTLWTIHKTPNETHRMEFRYWTAEDRAACRKPADYSAHAMKVLPVEGVEFEATARLYAMKQEKNRGLLIFVTDNNWPGTLCGVAYDHNGTPEDTSDDRMVKLKSFVTEKGEAITDVTWPGVAFEDPYDGAILLGDPYGIIVTDREKLFNGGKPVGEILAPKVVDNAGFPNEIIGLGGLHGGVYDIAADAAGRKWIATENDGLYCLSADRSEVLAHFNSSNSPVGDNIVGVCYNPERNSMWIGTFKGAYEFMAEGNEGGDMAVAHKVMPYSVHPDYQGHVLFRGLADGRKYRIVNPEGEFVAEIESRQGRAQWHPAGAAPGIYRLAAGDEYVEGYEVIVNK